MFQITVPELVSSTHQYAVDALKRHYPSVQGRFQYRIFAFGRHTDAENFARDFSPRQTPNKSLEGAWLVQVAV